MCKHFEIRPLAKDKMLFEDFFYFYLWRPSWSMERNHCGLLGFPIDTTVARFDPEVILLLQSKFRL